MNSMFDGAATFGQNLGNWYVVLDDTTIDRIRVPEIVGTISAQNDFLGNHNATYAIGQGGRPEL